MQRGALSRRATIATIERVHPTFATRAFVAQALRGYEDLALRPRASRPTALGCDPHPVIALLERLRDDPDALVRRSVANHLDDLGRADPALLVDVCTRWAQDASPQRARLVRHALRTLVARGDPHALAVLGYGARAEVALRDASIVPARVPIGGAVRVSFALASAAPHPQRVLVDLRVTCTGARDGVVRAKVFALDAGELPPGGAMRFGKRLSLRQMPTRTHHPGSHRVEARVNGVSYEVGTFELTA